MSRLDDIEARLAKLESGGDLGARVASLEEQLGLSSTAPQSVTFGTHCSRCGLDQMPGFRCAQTKCPLNPQ